MKYITLDEFLFQKKSYEIISPLKFFKCYKFYKTIKMWKSNLIKRKRLKAILNLKENLFYDDK